MNEDYVSFEVAKLLKEKGFDWFCENHYIVNCEPDGKTLAFAGFIYYKKPTLYIAQKWLRETKSIHINIAAFEGNYYAVLFKTNGSFIKNMVKEGPNRNGIWESYEDALNAGILEALKLI